MFRLVLDVIHYGRGRGLAYGKCAVATLPMKTRELRTLGLYPLGRACFQCLDNVGNGSYPRLAEEQMNMVFNATDL